ncbi:Ig-like domain-containing protein [Hyalangium rubrum]|uniref:Ig-like domain-containing protein n=1 Tax=Hyalangium rubrum TaxID=3103134 RepID=A0ABU5H6S3_9BACT|nr:Ig-like domain-containing protein [Hyalangium sp. s54d21]MDY7229175.1 Ig-like domain-containing protein [Hyalangium sp. s54d21]
MNHPPLNRLVLVSVLLSLGMACRDPAPASLAAHPAPPHVSPEAPGTPFDLGEVIRRAHFAYRPEGNGWTAGHGTWSARATAQGLTITPRHALEPAAQASAPRILKGTPITFGAPVLSRGERQLERAAPKGTVREDGSLALTWGEVEERLENSEDGITQSLRFTREPRGEGALRLRMPVSGLGFAGETPRGAHFADETGLGVRHGDATWTDASGRRTELRTRAVEGGVEFQVPAALLTGSSFPSTLAFNISPEFGLDLPVLNPGAGTQREPAVASNGTDYLVVWTDTRNEEGTSDLYATRVSASGDVLDPLGIDLTPTTNAQSNAAVVFDGTNYFVVWQDGRRGSGTDIYGARVSPSGVVLDPSGLAISTSGTLNHFKRQPKLLFDGTNHLVVWQEQLGFTTPFDLYGQRVSRTGALVGSRITVCNTTSNQSNAALGFDGTNYLVVWQDDRAGNDDLYGTRISTLGTVLDPPSGLALITTSTAQGNPTVAFNGLSYFIAWNEFSTQGDIFGARITTSGSVLDPSGLALIQATANQTHPKLLRRGNEYLLTWQDFRLGQWDIYAARVNFTGASIDGQGFPIYTGAGNQTGPVTAANSTGSLIAWTDAQALDIRGARLNSTRTVLDPSGLTISTAPNSQVAPAMAFDGTNYLVTWHDNRDGEFNLYGVRVSSDGTVLDPSGFVISNALSHQRYPAVSFDGTNYLVVWEDSRASPLDIYGARVSPAGTVLDPNGFLIFDGANWQEQPAVAFDGTNHLVVWESVSGSIVVIRATRISPAGVVLDPTGITLGTSPQSRYDPKLAFDGTNYLVVWSDYRDAPYFDIYGTRVSPAGAVLDPTGILFAGGTDSQRNPALAFDGTHYLVVWGDHRGWNLFAQRFTPAGTSPDAAPIPLSQAAQTQYYPSVTYDGTEFVIAWQDNRSDAGYDIYGGRITREGVPRDSDGFILSATPTAEVSPALASSGGGNSLVVYQSRDLSLGRNVQRLRARRITQTNTPPMANPGSVTTGEDVPASVVLSGSDPEGDALTYTLVSAPAHGTLTGTAPSLTYTPAPDYHGPDSFTFTVSDSLGTSAPATVSLTITPVNDAPGAASLSLVTPEDTGKELTLTGSDLDGDPLSFTVASAPSHGTLTGTAPNLTYTPAPDYHGPDSFTFTVSDGQSTSAPATVSIDVTSENDQPIALAQSRETDEDVPLSLTLTGSDVDGDPLTFSITTMPEHGTLTGTPPNLTYAPASDYHGPDSFTFVAFDGQAFSVPATVSISVAPRNDVPEATARSVTTEEDTSLPVALSGSDVDGDSLTFALASQPTHGTLSGTAPNLIYTPASDYHGPDSFTFTVSDGQLTSTPATVALTVLSRNDSPVARARSQTTEEDTQVLVSLSGTDVDGDTLSFTVVSDPSHGTLTGTAPDLTYTPAPGYHGPDRFTFTVSDGQISSAPATVSLTITSVSDLPVAHAQDATTSEDTEVSLTLTGSDEDGTSLSFQIASEPTHGTLIGVAPSLTYTPAPDYHGADSFTFTVSDGQGSSAPATVSLTVTPLNDAPVAVAHSLTTEEDTATAITLAGSDVDGDTLSFALASQPAHGTLTGTAPDLTYTPAPDYHGSDSFTFTVSDGQATSAPATVSLTVVSRNDAPVSEPQALTVPAGHPTPLYLTGNDEDGDPLTFSIVTPPETGRLTGTPPDVVYTAPANFLGTTRFTFSVSDGSESSLSEVQVTVVKRSLTVSAAVDSRRPAEGQQVRFYANAVDEAGASISLEWNFGDGQTSTEELPVHAFTAPGTYDVRLKATTATEEASTTLRIRVRSADAIPVGTSAAPSSSHVGEEGSSLSFRVEAPQPALTYTWDFGDGTANTTGTTASHTWADDGRFTLKLTASDTRGQHWVATRTITIHNAPPVPLPQARVTARVGEPVSVQLAGTDAAGARDPLQWELLGGEGMLSSDGMFRWTPTQPGLATVVTTVMDDDGGEAPLVFQVSSDASAEPEEPEPEEPEPEPSTGCGCGTTSGSASNALGLGLLLALLTFSRRLLG